MLNLAKYHSKVSTIYQICRKYSEIVTQNTGIAKSYDPTQHTLIPDIFSYKYYDNYLGSCILMTLFYWSGYVIKENKTRTLILVDPGNYEISSRNVEKMEIELGYKLGYILSTHHHENHNGATNKFLARWPNVKIIAGKYWLSFFKFLGNYGKIKPYFTKLVDEIQPFEIGDLSICLFHTPGHTDDSCSFIFHHVTSDSTKTPIIFSGDTLYIG